METVRQNVLLERTGIFGQTSDKKFEYTMEHKKTNFLMNNLFSMGYSTITLCNLFAEVTDYRVYIKYIKPAI